MIHNPYLKALHELLDKNVIYRDHDGHLYVGMIGDASFEDDLSPEARETIYRIIRERGDQ